MVVGIAGASGSGKSSLAAAIMKEIPNVAVISEDSYYRDLSHLPMSERWKANFDHPRSLEHSLLIQHIEDISMGKPVDIPYYDYSTCTRKQETRKIDDCLVLVLEGILVLADKNLRKLMDIRIFVDTPLDLCLMRRLQRDVAERGRDISSGIEQYCKITRPMFMRYIEPSKKYAHLLVPRGGHNKVAIEIVRTMLMKLVQSAAKNG